jgi:hypothetical protein
LKEQGLIWSGKLKWTTGAEIKELSHRVECLNPVGGLKVSLKKKCTNDIIDRTESPLSFAILWRGMRAGEVKDYPCGREKGP